MRWTTLVVAMILFGCSGPKEEPIFETTVALAPGMVPVSVDLRDYVVPAAPDPQLCALLRPGSSDTELAQAIQEGRLQVALLEVGLDFVQLGGAPLATSWGGPAVPGSGVIKDGIFAAELKRGTLVSPLFDALKELADRAKAGAEAGGCTFGGRLLLAMAGRLPFSTVREAMYSSGQAQFADFAFLTADSQPVASLPAPPGDRQVTISVAPGGRLEVVGQTGAPVASGDLDRLDALLSEALGDQSKLGCAIVAPRTDVPFSELAAVQQALARRGVKGVVAGGVDESPSPPAPSEASARRRSWRIGDPIVVLETSLPAIRLQAEDGECRPDGTPVLGLRVGPDDPFGALLGPASPKRGTAGAPASKITVEIEARGEATDRDAASRTVKRYLGRVRTCHQRGLERDPLLAGPLRLAWRVGETGEVEDLRIVDDQIGDRELAACVHRVVSRIRQNPAPTRSVEVEATYSLVVERAAPPEADRSAP